MLYSCLTESENNGSAGSQRQRRTMALACAELEDRWHWLTETETNDGAGSLRESSGGELFHEERSQYSSTTDNAHVKL